MLLQSQTPRRAANSAEGVKFSRAGAPSRRRPPRREAGAEKRVGEFRRAGAPPSPRRQWPGGRNTTEVLLHLSRRPSAAAAACRSGSRAVDAAEPWGRCPEFAVAPLGWAVRGGGGGSLLRYTICEYHIQ